MKHTDQIGNVFHFSKTPTRIVSLVPSQTELLVDLGLRVNLLGITKFCVHPPNLKKEIQVVGGTKQVNFKKIKELKPDIIICNKEENTKEMVVSLSEIAPVWVTDIITIEDNNDMILDLGNVFNVFYKATEIVANITSEEKKFKQFIDGRPIQKVAYLIWKNPYMAVGNNTFINSLLALLHFENVFIDKDSRYPEIDENDLSLAAFILLSSEPYPFNETDVLNLKNTLKKDVLLVDGEYFSWYGSRLLKAFEYFKTLVT